MTVTHLLWVAVTGSLGAPDDDRHIGFAVEACWFITNTDLVAVGARGDHQYIHPLKPAASDRAPNPMADDQWERLPIVEAVDALPGLRADWVNRPHCSPRHVEHAVTSMITNAGLAPAYDRIMLAGPDLTRDLPLVLALIPDLSTALHQAGYLDTSKARPLIDAFAPHPVVWPEPHNLRAHHRLNAAVGAARLAHRLMNREPADAPLR